MMAVAGILGTELLGVQPSWWEAGAKDYGVPMAPLTAMEFLIMGFLETKRYQGFKETGTVSGARSAGHRQGGPGWANSRRGSTAETAADQQLLGSSRCLKTRVGWKSCSETGAAVEQVLVLGAGTRLYYTSKLQPTAASVIGCLPVHALLCLRCPSVCLLCSRQLCLLPPCPSLPSFQSGLINQFPFDPAGMNSPDMAVKEVKNGRLAMVSRAARGGGRWDSWEMQRCSPPAWGHCSGAP
jgi:hypothetical protein